jgi:hypothetical protein
LSLKGKWIALAKKWIADNSPCSLDDYFMNVTPLMPTHVTAFRSTADCGLALAKSALARLKNPRSGDCFKVKVEGELITVARVRERSNSFYCFDERFSELLNGDEIDVSNVDIKSCKERSAFREHLKRKGWVRFKRNTYRRAKGD